MNRDAIVWLTIDQVAERLQLKRSSTYKCLPALDTVQLGRGQRVVETSLTRLQLRAQEIGLWPAVAELSGAKALLALPADPDPAPPAEKPAKKRTERQKPAKKRNVGYLHLVDEPLGRRRK